MLSIWLFGGVPIPCSRSTSDEPMVNVAPLSTNWKALPAPVIRADNTTGVLALSETGPSDEISTVPESGPVIWIWPADSSPMPPLPALTFPVRTRLPDPVTRNAILALLVVTPDSEPTNATPLMGSRNFPPKMLATSTVPIVRSLALLRNTKLSPAPSTCAANVDTTLGDAWSVGPTKAPSDTRSCDRIANADAMIGDACVTVPAEDSPTIPVPASTGWFRARLPAVVVSRRMLPPFVVTPESPPAGSAIRVCGSS